MVMIVCSTMEISRESATYLGSFAQEAAAVDDAIPDDLTEAEQAVWRDPDLLARIEAVLDEPSRAVLLDWPLTVAMTSLLALSSHGISGSMTYLVTKNN